MFFTQLNKKLKETKMTYLKKDEQVTKVANSKGEYFKVTHPNFDDIIVINDNAYFYFEDHEDQALNAWLGCSIMSDGKITQDWVEVNLDALPSFERNTLINLHNFAKDLK